MSGTSEAFAIPSPALGEQIRGSIVHPDADPVALVGGVSIGAAGVLRIALAHPHLFDGGGQSASFSAKLVLPGAGLARSSQIGFRCAVELERARDGPPRG